MLVKGHMTSNQMKYIIMFLFKYTCMPQQLETWDIHYSYDIINHKICAALTQGTQTFLIMNIVTFKVHTWIQSLYKNQLTQEVSIQIQSSVSNGQTLILELLTCQILFWWNIWEICFVYKNAIYATVNLDEVHIAL